MELYGIFAISFHNYRTMDEMGQPGLHEIRLEEVLSALGDSTRLRIVRRLLSEGETSCKSLCGEAPKSTISHHFRVLRESGVTNTRIVGTQRLVSVREEELEWKFPGLLRIVQEDSEDLARSRGLEPPTLSSAS
jgi:DNA-binding transcriptional ArsR family regulator